MATKPNETYKWGENATHEQVAAYEDTGWPSDAIPPKRTQFNWYQNLVGRWLEWVEDAVDEIVETVLDAWFVEVAGLQSVPHKTGIYKHELEPRFYLVHGDQMATVGFSGPYFTARYYTWDGSQWVEGPFVLDRSNTRTDILQESETDYVTPKGLVDYFSVKDSPPSIIDGVPNKTGIYQVAAGSGGISGGLAIVIENRMWFISTSTQTSLDKNRFFLWENGIWVEKNSQ